MSLGMRRTFSAVTKDNEATCFDAGSFVPANSIPLRYFYLLISYYNNMI